MSDRGNCSHCHRSSSIQGDLDYVGELELTYAANGIVFFLLTWLRANH